MRQAVPKACDNGFLVLDLLELLQKAEESLGLGGARRASDAGAEPAKSGPAESADANTQLEMLQTIDQMKARLDRGFRNQKASGNLNIEGLSDVVPVEKVLSADFCVVASYVCDNILENFLTKPALQSQLSEAQIRILNNFKEHRQQRSENWNYFNNQHEILRLVEQFVSSA